LISMPPPAIPISRRNVSLSLGSWLKLATIFKSS